MVDINNETEMKFRRWTVLILGILIFGFGGLYTLKKLNLISPYKVGQQIDSFNRVKVYYNGSVAHTGAATGARTNIISD